MTMVKEFKEFAMKGNVVDMAVGVVIGGAFGKIVSSFLNDILMPPLGLLTGGVNFNDQKLVVPSVIGVNRAVTIGYGAFITTVIDFTVVAFAVFLLVKAMNTLKREAPAAPPAPTEKECGECLMNIPIKAKRCSHCAQAVLTLLVVMLCAVGARADDLTGRLGAGGSLGGDFATGSKWVSDQHDPGLGLGAWLRYGISKRWSLGLAYDNTAFSKGPTRLETLLLSGAYSLSPQSQWNPNVHAGLGTAFVRNAELSKPTELGLNVGVGVDRFVTPCFSLGAALDWFSASRKNSSFHDVNALRAGLVAGVWFGGQRAPAKVAAAPVTPPPAPAPVLPAPVPVPAALPAEKVTIDLDVQFDTAQSVVKAEYDDRLKKAADFLKSYPSSKAEIEGHTDNVGKADYNIALSQKRAEAVRQALIDRFGADGARLSAKGYGPDKPIAGNNTPEGRAKNRRVVATFTAIKP